MSFGLRAQRDSLGWMQGLWASCQCLLTRWQPGRGVGGCSSLGVGGSRVSPRLVSQGRRGKPSVFQPLQPSLERILPPPKRQRVFPFQAKLDNGASSWTSKLPLACPVLFWIDNLSASYCTKYSIGIVSLFLTAAFEVGFFFFFLVPLHSLWNPSSLLMRDRTQALDSESKES